MLDGLTGLAAFMNWQTESIPGPSYTWYKFWVQSGRGTDIKEDIKLKKDLTEEEIKSLLEDWVQDVLPMFYFTEAHVTYGYEEISVLV